MCEVFEKVVDLSRLAMLFLRYEPSWRASAIDCTYIDCNAALDAVVKRFHLNHGTAWVHRTCSGTR